MRKFPVIVAVTIVALLVLAVIAVSLALVLGVALGLGWLITVFLPFTLFEASLLSLVAVVVVGALWSRILNFVPNLIPGLYDGDEDDYVYDYEDEEDNIPASRFYKTDEDRTWEAWLRHQMANDIYLEIQESPQPVTPGGEQQLQELAIRLADVAMPLLKAKSGRARQLKVTVAALKKQMNKIGQRPYDDDILKLAATAVNEDLDFYHEELLDVIRFKRWNEPCDIF